MTAATLAKKFNVNVIKTGWSRNDRKYSAFLGGNGTGEPVVDIAEAYTLASLARKLEKRQAATQGKPLIEIL